MNPWTCRIACVVLLALAGPAAARTAWTDGPAFLYGPDLPSPRDTVTILGAPELPFNRDDVHIYLRGPDPVLSETRKISSAEIFSDKTVFQARLGELEAGRYRVEYYTASFAVGAVPAATLEFSVSTSGLRTVVEYFNAALDHYFITSDANEIALLDGGKLSGWTRTGETFRVLPPDAMPSNAAPACRYYGLPAAGLDTHFLSDDPAECAAVRTLWPDKWVLETDRAFGVMQGYPYSDIDECGGDDYVPWRPLFRLYNNRPDAGHRYTINPRIRDEMMAKGWILEGRHRAYGSMVYAMCVFR